LLVENIVDRLEISDECLLVEVFTKGYFDWGGLI